MPIYKNWTFWIFVVTVINLVIILLKSWADARAMNKLMTNDLHHLQLDVKDIKEDVRIIKDQSQENKESIATINTRCAERHKA